jgi:hypothetical protein
MCLFIANVPYALSDPAAGASPCTVTTSTRPFVLLNAASLHRLRADAQATGSRHALYLSAVKHKADHWLALPVAVPPRSGYWHDFVCVDGTRLSAPDPPHLVPDLTSATEFVCPACGRKYNGPKIEGAFRAVEHAWLTEACLDLALAGAVEQRDDYRRKAADILLRYADAYPGRHTSHIVGGIFYQSLDEAVNMITLAQAYDLLADTGVLTPAQCEHIERDLFWESAEGLLAMGVGGNWGSWHLSAVGVIGLATHHQRFIDYGISNFKSQVASQLGDDGLWPESVHTYHFYPMRAFLHLAEACANVGVDLYNWEARPGKGLRAMFTAPLYYMYPNFRLPAINDGWFGTYLPLDVYQVGFERYRDPQLGWAIHMLDYLGLQAKTESPDVVALWSLLHASADRSLISALSPPAFRATNFPVLGIACLRLPMVPDGPGFDTMLTFDYGPFRGHGQPDKMGITYFADNKLLAADYGTCSYGSKLLPYYKSTQSHNTLRFDGKDQPATKSGRLIGFKDAGFVQLACAETTEICTGATWRRAVVLARPFAIVVDEVNADRDHQVDWLLHCEGDKLELPGKSETVTTDTVGLQFFTDTRRVQPNQFARAMWTSGTQPMLSAEFPTTTDTQYFSAMCPAESALHQVPALVARQQGRSAVFASMLIPPNSPVLVSSTGPKLVQTSPTRWTIRGGEREGWFELAHDHLSFSGTWNGTNPVEVRVELSSTLEPIGQTGIYSAAMNRR